MFRHANPIGAGNTTDLNDYRHTEISKFKPLIAGREQKKSGSIHPWILTKNG